MYSYKKFLNIEQFNVIGFQKIYVVDDLIMDFVAGAIVFVIGYKINKSVLGLDVEGNEVFNIFEQAKVWEYVFGLLIIFFIVYVILAGFFVYVFLCSQYEDIVV